MRARIRGWLFVACVLVPWVSGAQEFAWERATLDVGVATQLPACHEFSVGEYSSSSCKGAVLGSFASALRAPGGFLVRPALQLGAGYDTDLVGAHYFDVREPAPLQEVRLTLGVGFGYAGPIRGGEIRIVGGPRLGLVDVPSGVRGRLQGDGYDVDPHGALSLAGELHLELDWEAGEKVRLGPRVRFTAGNQVFMLSATDCADDSAWCDDVLLLNGDVEMEIIVAFAMSLPSAGPVGFYLEAGPRLDITAYTPPQHQNLFERHYALPHATLDVTPWIVVGAQIRLGG